jgi:hypothetical protein
MDVVIYLLHILDLVLTTESKHLKRKLIFVHSSINYFQMRKFAYSCMVA